MIFDPNEDVPKKGDKGFKRTDDLEWEMVGTLRADGKWFPLIDSAWATEILRLALFRDPQSIGAMDNGDPHKLYPVFVKRSVGDGDGGDVIHHIMISFDSGELDYSNLDELEQG